MRSMPSPSGRPEVEQEHVGVVRRARAARPPADRPASTTRKPCARERGAQEPPHGRLVLDDQHERSRRGHAPTPSLRRPLRGVGRRGRRLEDGQRQAEHRPAARAVRGREPPAVRVRDGARDGEAEPHAADARMRRPDGTSRTRAPPHPAGSRARDRRPRPRASPPSRRARISMSEPGGVYFAAFSSRFTKQLLARGSGSIDSERDARPGCRSSPGARRARSSTRVSAEPTTSSSGTHSRLGSTTPDSSRVMSRRFETSRSSRSASSHDGRRELAPERGVARAVVEQQRAGPGDRRERRAQVVGDGGEQPAPELLRLRPQRRRAAPLRRGGTRSSATAAWRPSASSSSRCSPESRRSAGGVTASTASTSPKVRSGTQQRGLARERVGARARPGGRARAPTARRRAPRVRGAPRGAAATGRARRGRAPRAGPPSHVERLRRRPARTRAATPRASTAAPSSRLSA